MHWRIMWAITVLALAVPGGAHASPALDHPAVQNLLALSEEGATEKKVLDRVDQIGAFPEFDGHDLAELKRRGLSDRVLLRMIELTVAGPTPTADARDTAYIQAMAPDDKGFLRVVLECPFEVTFYELAVDGDIKLSEGTLWEGSVEPGGHLAPTVAVSPEGPTIVFEALVRPGRHTTAFGFAVSEIEEDPSSVWGEAGGEHYETRGIRAGRGSIPGQAPVGNPGATCQLAGGEVCEVLVTPQRTSSSLLRGASVYNVRYQVQMFGVPDDEEETPDDESPPADGDL